MDVCEICLYTRREKKKKNRKKREGSCIVSEGNELRRERGREEEKEEEDSIRGSHTTATNKIITLSPVGKASPKKRQPPFCVKQSDEKGEELSILV